MDERGTEEFARSWRADRLERRPLILPRQRYTYPAAVDEVERGALELMITPDGGEGFLATCALGFNDRSMPTGVWRCPHPDWLCAVAGGYAYMIDTRRPGQWEQVEYRPVVTVLPLVEHGLLVFAGFHSLAAYGREGRRWKTGRLTAEGVRLGEVRDGRLQGWGWEMLSDREMEFSIDLATGEHSGGVPL